MTAKRIAASTNTPFPSVTARAIFDDPDFTERLLSLAARWADEYQYEALMDYADAVVPFVHPYGAKVVRMFRRPFGVRLEIAGVQFDFTVTASEYRFKRVA